MPTTSTRHRNRPGGERGSATVELAILFPALLLVVTALVQYGLWFHARSIALAAAQEGVAAARTYIAPFQDGPGAALGFVNQHGGDTLLNATATLTTLGAGQVEIVVSGHALSVIPGVGGAAVRQSAAGPVERFTQAQP
ncbi:MAG: pilus assembly protein [Cellulomonadaceae bacterium]|nr:pilus assembly protein [Cellulomonadaceae bacterium]